MDSPWITRPVVKFQTHCRQSEREVEGCDEFSLGKKILSYFQDSTRKCAVIISPYKSETQEDKVIDKDVIGITNKAMFAWIQCGFNRIKINVPGSRGGSPGLKWWL